MIRELVTIDILVPFYGDPDFLKEAIASIRGQRDPSWRAIVVNDRYPDPDVVAWLDEIDDPRVVVLHNETNLGANLNYKAALALATGDYVVFMGADDRMLPNYVTRMRELLSGPLPDVVHPAVRVIDGQGISCLPFSDRVKRMLRPKGDGTPTTDAEGLAVSLFRGNWTYFPSICWRRETIQRIGFRGYDVVQDLALLTDVVIAGGQVIVDDVTVFEYRRHTGSDSSLRAASASRFDEERAYYRQMNEEFTALGWSRAARAARAHLSSRAHALATVPLSLSAGDGARTRRLAKHAVGR